MYGRHFSKVDASLDIGLSPIDVGQALIYVDKPAAQRYSKVNLSLVQHKAKIIESKIHHLIYLNEMTRHDFIPALDGIITADICPGKSVKKDLLQYVDYLSYLMKILMVIFPSMQKQPKVG